MAFFVFWAGGDYWENANSLLAEGAGAGLVQDIQLGGFVEFVKAEAAPPHSKVGVGRLKVAATRGELTALQGNLIFKDYLARVRARLVVVRLKTGRTHRDAAGNRQDVRTETN